MKKAQVQEKEEETGNEATESAIASAGEESGEGLFFNF